MAGPEQEIIESNHEYNKPQRYSNDESSSPNDSDDEANYTKDAPNLNFTSDEDSQIGSRQLMYKFVFTFTFYLLTSVVDLYNYK